jgi:hypothetical protein
MRRAAEALDCEVVCFVIPRETVARSYLDLAQVHDPAANHLRATDHSTALKRQGTPDDAP